MGADTPKPYLNLKGVTVLERTLTCFMGLRGLQQIVVATSEIYIKQTGEMLERLFPNVETGVTEGGERRQDSIYQALQAVNETSDLVAVHDAVRPFITKNVISDCLNAASNVGGAIVGVPVKDTIKRVDAERMIKTTPERSFLWQAQTPQIFNREQFLKAYEYANQNHVVVTDDASLFEAAGMRVKLIEGERDNFKLTYPIDFKIAEMLTETHIAGGTR